MKAKIVSKIHLKDTWFRKDWSVIEVFHVESSSCGGRKKERGFLGSQRVPMGVTDIAMQCTVQGTELLPRGYIVVL